MAPQTSDRLPNEADCPVPLEVLALLLRSDTAVKKAMIGKLDGRTRARLAFFCYNRVHLRQLAFQVAMLCEISDLRVLAGAKGDLLRAQASEEDAFREESQSRIRGVTLARTAHG